MATAVSHGRLKGKRCVVTGAAQGNYQPQVTPSISDTDHIRFGIYFRIGKFSGHIRCRIYFKIGKFSGHIRCRIYFKIGKFTGLLGLHFLFNIVSEA